MKLSRDATVVFILTSGIIALPPFARGGCLDLSEQLATEYLQNIGCKSVIYQPDGNVPPDFVVDDGIGVEVRRLNQNEITDSGYRGLEETSVPLLMKIKRLLNSFGPPDSGTRWFVSYTFRRPLSWKGLKGPLRDALTTFRNSRIESCYATVTISDTFDIDLIRATNAHSHFFVLGGYSDSDSGGWVLSEALRNLRICIREKSRKITRARDRYNEWWLILIDYIGYGAYDCDRSTFRKHLALEHDWNRIFLVNPIKPTVAFEL